MKLAYADADEFVTERIRTICRPPDKTPIYEWARQIKMDATSPIAGNYSIENSIWMREQLDAFQDPDVRMVTSIGPNQGGRTKTMEVASLWTPVNRPGPMQWNTYKDDSAKDFAQERWWPMARSCPDVVEKLPSQGTGLGHDRHKEMIRRVIFTDGMPFKMQGCAESNLEEKSIMTQFNDECWQWPVGRLEVAWKRCNVSYAWNYKVWNGSIPGIDGDDIDLAFKSGSQEFWHWRCLKCGRKQVPKWGKPGVRGGIHWERDAKTKPKDRDWDFAEVSKTVRYECEHCKEDFADAARTRRLLNDSALYVALNPDAPDWHRSFSFNVLTVNWPGITWAQWVVEFLKACDQMKRWGNLEPLKQFWTRRMTESWEESRHAYATRKVVLSDYSMGEPNQWRTKQWERERMRFAAFDKQEKGYPFVIRAVASDGDSRLIDRGVAENEWLSSYEEIEAKRKDFGIQPQCVIIDSAYETREVYAAAVKYGWTCMRGVDKAEPFKHAKEVPDERSGLIKKVFYELPYSELKLSDPFMGTEQQQLNRRQTGMRVATVRKFARRFDWINLHVKNLLDAFRKGSAVDFSVPADVGAEYMRQMNAEVRHRIIDQRGRTSEWWSNRNAKGQGIPRANHAWDCECMIVVAMCLQGLINLTDWQAVGAPPIVNDRSAS